MKMTTCENCEGEGRFHRNIVDGWDYWDEGEEWVACPVCGGSGWLTEPIEHPPQLVMDEAFEPVEQGNG